MILLNCNEKTALSYIKQNMIAVLGLSSLAALIFSLFRPLPKLGTRKKSIIVSLGFLIFFLAISPKVPTESTNTKVQVVSTIEKATSIPMPSNTPTINDTPVPTEKPKATPTEVPLEEKVKAAVTNKIKNATIEIVDAEDSKTYKKIPGKKDVYIDYEMGDAFWDLNAAKNASYKIATELMPIVFPIDPVIESILVSATIPTKDVYGKSTTDVLNAITLSRNTYVKINFSDFDYHNIPTISDFFSENKKIK
jgi:hypothetical protein